MSDSMVTDDAGASGPVPASKPVTVLVADDQRLVREGIASLLDIQEGIRVVGEAVNGDEAVEQALALRPDVVLMDVRMPVLDGIAATAQVHRQLPGCQVIMLTTFDDEEYIVKSLRAGAVGYVGLLADGADKRVPVAAPPPVDADLTERELEVLRLIGTGATNREIADRLVVSEGTVKNHVSSILGRLGLRDRTQAALYAHQHGLV